MLPDALLYPSWKVQEVPAGYIVRNPPWSPNFGSAVSKIAWGSNFDIPHGCSKPPNFPNHFLMIHWLVLGRMAPWHSAPSWTHVELCNSGCLLGCYKSTDSTNDFVTASLRKKNGIVLLQYPLCLFFVSSDSSQQQCCVISTHVTDTQFSEHQRRAPSCISHL